MNEKLWRRKKTPERETKQRAFCKRFVLTVQKRTEKFIYFFQHIFPFSVSLVLAFSCINIAYVTYYVQTKCIRNSKAHTKCVEIKCCQGNFSQTNLKQS